MVCQVKDLRSDFYCLRSLLSDPHHGLLTWNEALEERLLQIQGKINQLQEENIVRQKEGVLGIIIDLLAKKLQDKKLKKEKADNIWKIIEIAKRVKQATTEDDITSAMKNLHKIA